MALHSRFAAMLFAFSMCAAAGALTAKKEGAAGPQVPTASGTVEGTTSSDGKVRIFKGIPFAAPPVGNLRWKAPQSAAPWTGVRKATQFGARCMQGNIFGDMVFRDSGPSEDCLYLNVWVPAASAGARLPVMVWIYGGGFQAGATSEPRQDGEMLAKKGVVVVSMNYRLGLFGFYAHPELAKESGRNSAGNYGLLDQFAALQWVQQNISAFGGDPRNVTIFGESAGSFSVSALMASPLSRLLFQRAIGESGSMLGKSQAMRLLADSEADSVKFAESIGATSLEAMRAKPAAELLDAIMKARANGFRFWPNVDGYFFPQDPHDIYAAGQQASVPLLAGWNRDEGSMQGFFQKDDPTDASFVKRAQELFGGQANEFLKLYPHSTDAEAQRSAQDYSGDQFIAFGTWKWIEMQRTAGKSTVYRYEFDDAPPQPAGQPSNGAYHSAEIEFVFEALPSKNFPWRPEDQKLSDLVSTYWTNFAKTGNPNGTGLPQWPQNDPTQFQVMHLSFDSHTEPDTHRARYEFLDKLPTLKQ